MTAVLMTPPYVEFMDANGDPLAGGKVYAYEAGTLTPKNTFTDSTEATPNTNPVILDSAGRASIWINGSYDFVIKTSADVTIRTAEDVTSFSTSATNLNSLLPPQTGNAGKFLTTDGVNSSWATNANKVLKVQTFLSSTTWTCPAGVTSIYLDGCGGGGGAGGGATIAPGGGGGGAQAVKGTNLTVVPATVYTVTIGAGGTGATGSANNGTAGGSTSLVTLIT